jgi:predicted MFS family arabinose efflux permease
MPEGDRDGQRRPPRLLLAVLCAAGVANVYYAQPLLARIGTDLAIPVSDLGWVVALSQLGYLVGLVVLVPLGDVLSRRVLIAAQLVATAVGTTIAATAPTATGLLVGVTIAGLFSVVVQIAVAFAAAISDPAERGRTIGVVTSGVVVGIILARTVSGAVADLAGWRAVYLASAVLCAALAMAAAAALPRDRHREHAHPDEHGRRRRYLAALASVVALTATNRAFRVRAGMTFFLFASFGVLWSGIALPLSAAPWHLSTTEIGLFGLAGLAGVLGAARAGRWADRGHGHVVTAAALLLLIASWAAIGQTTSSLLSLIVGVVVLDLAVQAVHVTSQNDIIATRPDAGSQLIGSDGVFYSLGSALGAATTTTLYDHAGWGVVSLTGAGYAAAALAVWCVDQLLLRRTSREVSSRRVRAGSSGLRGCRSRRHGRENPRRTGRARRRPLGCFGDGEVDRDGIRNPASWPTIWGRSRGVRSGTGRTFGQRG